MEAYSINECPVKSMGMLLSIHHHVDTVFGHVSLDTYQGVNEI